jgi:hypothetical protein
LGGRGGRLIGSFVRISIVLRWRSTVRHESQILARSTPSKETTKREILHAMPGSPGTVRDAGCVLIDGLRKLQDKWPIAHHILQVPVPVNA